MDERLAGVPGFGLCESCTYRESGPAALCYACARQTVEEPAEPNERCSTCDLPFMEGEKSCRNPVCNFADRWFTWNFAIAMRSGALQTAINRYKYEGRTGWALIFGRILAGFLEERPATFHEFQLILPSPSWIGDGGRNFDHTSDVLSRAAAEVPPNSGWPFDDPAEPTIAKTGPTPSMVKYSFKQRLRVAEGPLRESLAILHPDRVEGINVLVYDDVFTDGLTLREIARTLILDGGAAGVCGVTLCRQPFRPKPVAAIVAK